MCVGPSARRAKTNDAADGVRLADEAVALLAGTDDVSAQADALSDRAAVHRAVGDQTTARYDLMGALERYVAKGHRAGEVRTRAELDALSVAGDR